MHIIIPSSDPNLAQICLRSIAEHDPSFLDKILIVTDDPVAFRGITYEFPNVKLVMDNLPFNFARWINNGIEEVGDDATSWFLLNDDTELLTPNGLSVLEELVEREGAPPIISAAIRGTGGVIEQRQQTTGSLRVLDGHISFTAVAIHRRILDELGLPQLLDERFVGYGYEDNDLCEQARRQGIPIAVYDGCLIGHWKPHTTFSRNSGFKAQWLLNETLYWEKWAVPQEAVIVIGGSRSGATVYSAILDAMGYEMPDKPADFEESTSHYFRDTRLAKLSKHKQLGARNYIAGRNMQGKPWGTRIWPQPEAAINLLSSFTKLPRLLFVIRGKEGRIRSYAMANGVRYEDAKKRIEIEDEGMRQIREWVFAHYPQELIKTISYGELHDGTIDAIDHVARFVGHVESVASAWGIVRPELTVYDDHGDLIVHEPAEGFGRIAVGVRLTHPEAAFVGCYARLIQRGMDDDDVLLEPVIRAPSHWAASTLMKRFLATGCDTLLLIDDDMTFPPDLLEIMRENQENWRYDIVSALATQRIPPPRALVMRKGQQPDLPDALNGLYYNLLVEEVVDGKTLPVDATGFAFTLIRRQVIERMTDPEWGPNHTHYVSWGESGEGEDVNFCRRAGSHGFKVAVDAGAHVGHIGSVVYGYDEFDQWRGGREATGLSVDKLAELVESAIPVLSGDLLNTAVALLKQAREQ